MDFGTLEKSSPNHSELVEKTPYELIPPHTHTHTCKLREG